MPRPARPNIRRRARPSRVLAAGIALAAAGILLAGPLRNAPGVRAVPAATSRVLLPVVEASASVRQSAGRWIGNLRDADQLAAENEALRGELANLQVERALSLARIEELRDAGALAQEIPRAALYTQTAPVLGSVLDGRVRRLWIGLGAREGVRPGQAVLGPEGIVGMVAQTTADHALVQLVTDASSRWGAEAHERAEGGVVRGTGRADHLEFRLEKTTTRIEVGDLVATSGRRGSTAPAGIPIGRVVEVGIDSDGERRVVLAPASKAEELRHVFILSEEQIAWNP